MQTKNRHPKRAQLLLLLAALLAFRIGMLLAFFSRFFVDAKAMDFVKIHPGVSFPPDLQMQLSFFQSWWYMHGVGILIAIPLTYWSAKRLKFTKPWKATVLSLLVWFVVQFITHPPY